MLSGKITPRNLKNITKNDDSCLRGSNTFLSLRSENHTSPVSSMLPDQNTDTNSTAVPKYIEVRCGNLIGRLHAELFICPGIRERCIEIPELTNSMMTPVEFTIKAAKNKQKDWKGAIKHNGRMLRTLMETKQLDFYNHHVMCTSKCHSRNYITKTCRPKSTVTSHLLRNEHRKQITPSSQSSGSLLQDGLLKNPDFLTAISARLNMVQQKERGTAEREWFQKHQAIKQLFENDTVAFWMQTIQSNLFPVVINGISREIESITQNIILGRNLEGSAPVSPTKDNAYFRNENNITNSNYGNITDNLKLSSSEKLELMIKNTF